MNNDDLIYLQSKENTNLNIKLYNVKGTTKIKFDTKTNSYSLNGTEKNEGLSNFNTFMQPYYDKLDSIQKQKPTISNPSHFTENDRAAYQNHFLLQKAYKNKTENAKFAFIQKNKNNEYTRVLINEKLNSAFKEEDYELLKTFYNVLNKTDKQSANGKN